MKKIKKSKIKFLVVANKQVVFATEAKDSFSALREFRKVMRNTWINRTVEFQVIPEDTYGK